MSLFKLLDWKICLLLMAVIILWPLLFVPPSTWNEVFWRYFNETAIIEWIGALGLIFFFAILVTLAYTSLRAVFF